MPTDGEHKIKGYPEYAPSNDPRLQQQYELYGKDTSFEDANLAAGWGVGPTVTAEEFELGTPRNFNDVRDPNANMFRYGLWYDIYSNVEDPTILGFTCEIDDSIQSPLFSTGPYSAQAFIEKYSFLPEIAARAQILEQFQINIKMMFRSLESTRTNSTDLPYVKSHYLEKITGMKSLSNKFIKYKEDALLFTMHEDVTMYAQYLAQLYNNLAYSYRNGKTLIPENLLRFTLKIKVTEIRNFKTVVRAVFDDTDRETARRSLININSSGIKYSLYDCNFDFFESQNHGDEIQIGGIGASVASTSNMDFKIYYKVASRLFKSEVIDDLSGATNQRGDLNDREYDPRTRFDRDAFFKEADSQPDFSLDVREQENDFANNEGETQLTPANNVYNAPQRDENRLKSSQNMQTDPQLNDNLQSDSTGNNLKGKFNRIKDKAKGDLLNSVDRYKDARIKDFKKLQKSLISRGLGALQDLKEGLLEKFRRKRGDLLNQLIGELKDEVGIVQISPANVYTDTFDPNSVQSIINDLGAGVGGDLEDFLRGFNNF